MIFCRSSPAGAAKGYLSHVGDRFLALSHVEQETGAGGPIDGAVGLGSDQLVEFRHGGIAAALFREEADELKLRLLVAVLARDFIAQVCLGLVELVVRDIPPDQRRAQFRRVGKAADHFDQAGFDGGRVVQRRMNGQACCVKPDILGGQRDGFVNLGQGAGHVLRTQQIVDRDPPQHEVVGIVLLQLPGLSRGSDHCVDIVVFGRDAVIHDDLRNPDVRVVGGKRLGRGDLGARLDPVRAGTAMDARLRRASASSGYCSASRRY